jgi:transposase
LNKLQIKSQERFEIIFQANEGIITVPQAASLLGLSERQVQRLKKEVLNLGISALVHKKAVRNTSNKLSNDLINKIVGLKNLDDYKNINFLNFNEILATEYNIKIGYSTLYNLLTSNGFSSPKTKRRFKPHTRIPKSTLIFQVHASPFAWFGKRELLSLNGALDISRGELKSLYLSEIETLSGYFSMLQSTANPSCKASKDKGSNTISINSDEPVLVRKNENLSTMPDEIATYLLDNKELNELPLSSSSQIDTSMLENLWKSLQSRLSVEFSIRNITTIDKANEFLRIYIKRFNQLLLPPILGNSYSEILTTGANAETGLRYVTKKAGIVALAKHTPKIDTNQEKRRPSKRRVKQNYSREERDEEIINMLSEIFSRSFN